MNNRFLIMGAQAVSLLFSPFYLPVVAFALLLVFSYLHLLPLSYKMLLLAIVYAFTVLVPRFSIFVYRKVNKLTHFQLGHRRNRFIPYLLSIISYVCLLHVMRCMHMPNFTLGIIVSALAIQVVCALINLRTKVSTHSAAAGGVVGALVGFSFTFAFNPIFSLCLAVTLTGAVGSARLILRQHTLGEVGLGVLVGLLCGFLGVLLV
ncbi:MAG: hypothetical protein IKU63_01435 [Bacteroidaceae bacterium]|nr:hypothetical protein [Bacteroidaceae bacterium]